MEGRHVLFYDGVCGLCNRLVRFLSRRDRRDVFRFASLQSAFAAERLGALGRDPRDLDTVYLLTADGALLSRARAILFAAGELGGIWRVARIFAVLPGFLLNAVYRLVARTRYRLFGKHESCPLPSPEDKAKFIEV
jgi:predicted DCC family thiol-disulfide oxidoreductase YuxK